jgi:hypothetical protein
MTPNRAALIGIALLALCLGAGCASPAAPTNSGTLSGLVTEPSGAPIPGVLVTTRPNPSGGPARTGTATTGPDGRFEMRDVAGCLWVSTKKDGYEGGEWINCVEITQGTTFITTMQPVLRLQAGQSLDEQVLSNDMAWELNFLTDDACGPCKIVRIVAPVAGKLLVRLSWPGASDAMSLWLPPTPQSLPTHLEGMNEAVGAVDVTAGVEVAAYVAWDSGLGEGQQPFHLDSQLLPPGSDITTSAGERYPDGDRDVERIDRARDRNPHTAVRAGVYRRR